MVSHGITQNIMTNHNVGLFIFFIALPCDINSFSVCNGCKTCGLLPQQFPLVDHNFVVPNRQYSHLNGGDAQTKSRSYPLCKLTKFYSVGIIRSSELFVSILITTKPGTHLQAHWVESTSVLVKHPKYVCGQVFPILADNRGSIMEIRIIIRIVYLPSLSPGSAITIMQDT